MARFADGRKIEADIVIGADGIHSTVRDSLFGQIEPHFTGCVCWRGMVAVDRIPNADEYAQSTIWWGPYGHVVHYPVRRGELINFVAHIDSDAWTEESWINECDVSELLETYAGWHDNLLRLFETSDKYYKWALYDRDPLDKWTRGRATLLGDSAHPMLPYLGQGACMAIEDGYVLAELVARMPDDLGDALQTYEQLRKPRTSQAQLGSRDRARNNHLASPLARWRRDIQVAFKSRFSSDKSIHQGDWIFSYDVTEMPGLSELETGKTIAS